MNIKKIILLSLLTIFIFNSCASIVSRSTYPFTIETKPSGVNITIKDGKGMAIYKGSSPATVRLKASAGFFKKASYTVNISGEGYESKVLPINFKLDGWYFGNLLIGGIIGMLIVDPATGAMYKLDDEYMSISLDKATSSIDEPSFKVYDIANAPKQWKDNMVIIQP